MAEHCLCGPMGRYQECTEWRTCWSLSPGRNKRDGERIGGWVFDAEDQEWIEPATPTREP